MTHHNIRILLPSRGLKCQNMVKMRRTWSQERVANAWQPKFSSPTRAQHLLSPHRTFFWQPGVRLPPPVSTKHELSGRSSPTAPQLCHQSAQERARCPETNSSHSQDSFTGLCQKKLARTPRALRRGNLGSDAFDTRPDDDATRSSSGAR